MSLKEKAKTTAEITADLIVDGVEKEALKKWVLLVDAEKVEVERDNNTKAVNYLQEKNKELEGRIAEVNKILNSYPKHSYNEYIERLLEALKK